MTKSYLLGALHDGTKRKYTFRIAQKFESYVKEIKDIVQKMDYKAWTYKEGKSREVFIVEFSRKVLDGFKIKTREDKLEYITGYFDAEGSAPRKQSSRPYFYFCQKNLEDLTQVKEYLEEFGISCGEIHNPSRSKDPNYWRFYISAKSYKDFARLIKSKHPIKKKVLEMVI